MNASQTQSENMGGTSTHNRQRRGPPSFSSFPSHNVSQEIPMQAAPESYDVSSFAHETKMLPKHRFLRHTKKQDSSKDNGSGRSRQGTCRSVHGWIQCALLTSILFVVWSRMFSFRQRRQFQNKLDLLANGSPDGVKQGFSSSSSFTSPTTTHSPGLGGDRQREPDARAASPSPRPLHQRWLAKTKNGEADTEFVLEDRSINQPVTTASNGRAEATYVNHVLSSHNPPMLEDSILLPEQGSCAVARQAEPWHTDLPSDRTQRPSIALQVNPDCPFASSLWRSIPYSNQTIAHHSTDPQMTLVLFYYQDMALFSRHLHAWAMWPDTLLERYRFVVIDDGSPLGYRALDLIQHYQSVYDKSSSPSSSPAFREYPALDRVLQSIVWNATRFTLYQVEEDIPFNMGGVRNLAHVVAPTEWVLATDADVYINATVASYLWRKVRQQHAATTALHNSVKPKRQQRYAKEEDRIVFKFLNQLMPDRVTLAPHPSVMLSTKKAYWTVGGCDEDLVGQYGQTDILFLWKADRDATVTVVNVYQEMQDGCLYVQKWWKRESQHCLGPCPPSAPNHYNKATQQTAAWHRKKRSRILKYNMEIFRQKKRREIPFSNTFLRFQWHVVTFP